MKLLEWFLRLLLWTENRLRPSLDQAVASLPALEKNPFRYLGTREVRIGPRRHPLVSPLVGVPLGAAAGLVAGFFALAVLEANGFRGADLPDPVMLGGAVLGGLAGWPAVWRVSRGGELVLRDDGVTFSYRGRDVFCPWDVFDPTRPVEHTDETWSRLPVHPDRIARVLLAVCGTVRRSGAAVTAVHAGFDRPGLIARLRGTTGEPPRVIAVRDVYAVRREELFGFLLHIAPRCVTRS